MVEHSLLYVYFQCNMFYIQFVQSKNITFSKKYILNSLLPGLFINFVLNNYQYGASVIY